MSNFQPSALDALSQPEVSSDRYAVGRSNVLNRVSGIQTRGGLFRRTNVLYTKPATSDFSTFINQGSATLTDVGDALALEHDASNTSGDSVKLCVRSLPGGSWDVQLGAQRMFRFNNFIQGGLALRESGTGKFHTLGHFHGNSNNGIGEEWWNSPTSFNSDKRATHDQPEVLFFRARKVSSQYEFLISFDGAYYHRWDAANNLNAFFSTAPDQWGFYINTFNNVTPATSIRIDVFHWDE